MLIDAEKLRTRTNKLDRAVEREISTALNSTFPKSEIPLYKQGTVDKRKFQLSQLADVVLGIRLYNRFIGKGGVGLADSLC